MRDCELKKYQEKGQKQKLFIRENVSILELMEVKVI